MSAAGVPVTGAGIMLHSFLIPGPYVETTRKPTGSKIADGVSGFPRQAAGRCPGKRSSRLDNWCLRTATASLDERRSTCCSSGLFVYLDSESPHVERRQPHARALLDDELARASALCRRPASLSTRLVINTYRLACIGHFLVAALFVARFAA